MNLIKNMFFFIPRRFWKKFRYQKWMGKGNSIREYDLRYWITSSLPATQVSNSRTCPQRPRSPSRYQAPRPPASEEAQSCRQSPTERTGYKRPPPEYFERLLEQIQQIQSCQPSPTEAATSQFHKSPATPESTAEPTEESNNKPLSSRPLNTSQTSPSLCSVIKPQCSPPKPQPSRRQELQTPRPPILKPGDKSKSLGLL